MSFFVRRKSFKHFLYSSAIPYKMAIPADSKIKSFSDFNDLPIEAPFHSIFCDTPRMENFSNAPKDIFILSCVESQIRSLKGLTYVRTLILDNTKLQTLDYCPKNIYYISLINTKISDVSQIKINARNVNISNCEHILTLKNIWKGMPRCSTLTFRSPHLIISHAIHILRLRELTDLQVNDTPPWTILLKYVKRSKNGVTMRDIIQCKHELSNAGFAKMANI